MIDRSSLIARIQGTSAHVCLIQAGTGYGKSFLLASLGQRPGHVTLDLGEADPNPLSLARLLHRRLCERFGEQVSSQTAYELQRSDGRAPALAAALRYDLQHAMNTQDLHTVLLDNAYFLSAEGRSFLSDLLICHPGLSALRWVVACRTERDLPLQLLRPRVTCELLGENDLAFGAQAMCELGLSETEAERTRGWPAAVMFASIGDEPVTAAQALLSRLPETLLPSLRKASLLHVWKRGDPAHVQLDLQDGWLDDARRMGVPCMWVGEDTYSPHPIMVEVLLGELHARPREHLTAQQGLAASLLASQPLAAVNAYIRSGDETQARQILSGLLPKLQVQGQLTSALPMLRQLVTDETSPLYLGLAQAIFDSGQLSEGLQRAETALEATGRSAAAFALLGRMRLRTGNTRIAAQYLTSALELQMVGEEKLLLRAQLALALAVRGQAGEFRFAAEAVTHARMVFEQSGGAEVSEAELLARTALCLAYAATGRRNAARHAAASAGEAARVVRASPGVLMCLTYLGGFHADEGQHDLSAELLARAQELCGGNADSACAVLLTSLRARQALRLADAQGAAVYATQASTWYAVQQNLAARRDSLLLLAVTGVLPVSHATRFRLDELVRHFGADPAITNTVMLLEDTFVKGKPVPSAWCGDPDLSPEVRVLLAVWKLSQSPDDVLWQAELLYLRARLGNGTVAAYIRMLGVQPNAQLSLAPPSIGLALLRPRPQVRVDGKLFVLRDALMIPLIILVCKGRLESREAERLVHPSYGEASRKNSLNHLRSELRKWIGEGVPMVKTHGKLSLHDWTRSTDLDELSYCDFEQLVTLYRAPVYADLGPNVHPEIDSLRQLARTRLMSRMNEWRTLNPEAARLAWKRLLQVDERLAAYGSKELAAR